MLKMKNANGAQAGEIVVEARDVYKSFKSVEAVRGVNLTIKRGEFVALLGPNGAGKTTLVEMIEGIQKPDRGEIRIMGKKWKGAEDELHKMIGLSLQETRFVDKLTVEEILSLFAVFYDLDKSRVEEVIGLINLEEKRKDYTVNLSGGQRQKLALGIALLNNPAILLLDEPTTGLDPNARREIWSILLDLKERSKTSLVLTTHYMDEAERLCDYIVIIDHGKILKEGTLSDLILDWGENIIEFSLNGDAPSNEKAALIEKSFDVEWRESGRRGIFVVKDLQTDLPNFLKFLNDNKLSLSSFESRRRTLDDLFTSMTGRRLSE